MFKRVLIANRGEIAVRLIRACHELGVEAVAVYSEPDADALHVRLADDAVLIGPAPPGESYLRGDKLIAAAKSVGRHGHRELGYHQARGVVQLVFDQFEELGKVVLIDSAG